MNGWTLEYLRALPESDYDTVLALYLEELEAHRKAQP